MIADDYTLHKVLDKIKMIISIEEFNGTKIIVETDDKLPDDVTLKIAVLLITCVSRIKH